MTEVRNLAVEAAELLERAGAAPAGRAAQTLSAVPGPRSGRRCWCFGGGCGWPSTGVPGRPRSRSCVAGCGW